MVYDAPDGMRCDENDNLKVTSFPRFFFKISVPDIDVLPSILRYGNPGGATPQALLTICLVAPLF